MLVGNAIQGNASANLRGQGLVFLNWLGARNNAVQAMLNDPNILVLITANTGEGDQNTEIEWKNAKTRIKVFLFVEANTTVQQLEADLLHELVLHAEPAVLKHQHAVNHNAVPVYPTTDQDIENEETAEHSDVAGWERAALLALARNQGLFERLVADAASHDRQAATDLLTRLRANQRISAQLAQELQQNLVDVNLNDDSDGGGNDSD